MAFDVDVSLNLPKLIMFDDSNGNIIRSKIYRKRCDTTANPQPDEKG
jgi:hypothetical protein